MVKVTWFQTQIKSLDDGPDDGKGRNHRFATGILILRWPLILCLFVLAAGSAFYVGDVRFDADPVSLRDADSRSMKTLALLEERRDTFPFRLSLLRDNEEAAKKAVDDLSEISSVNQTRILSDLVPDNQNEKLELIDFSLPTFDTIVGGEGLEHASLPAGKQAGQALIDRLAALENRPEAVRFAALIGKLMRVDEEKQKQVEEDIFRYFPMMIARIGAQAEVDTITLEGLPEFFKNRFIDEKGRWRIDITPEKDIREQQNLLEFVRDVEAYDNQVSGAPLQIAKAGSVVSKSMIMAVSIAGILILTLSFAILQSVTTVLAIFLPLLLGGMMTAGASAFLDIPFNYANVIVLPLLIGLGVDSGVHVALRRRQVENSSKLYQSSTPRAVLFSGLTTIAAFATLSVSDHKGTASMGIMLAIAISLTLACSILLTPVLIDIFDSFFKRKRN